MLATFIPGTSPALVRTDRVASNSQYLRICGRSRHRAARQ